jgi:hypothetical protein
MKNVVDESKVEKSAEAASRCAGCSCEHCAEEVVKLVENGVRETADNIKRHPFGSLAIAFGAGAAVAFLVPRAVKR